MHVLNYAAGNHVKIRVLRSLFLFLFLLVFARCVFIGWAYFPTIVFEQGQIRFCISNLSLHLLSESIFLLKVFLYRI